MNAFNKTPESSHTVRFPDCDPFNHLNNAKYIDYFMNAREDHVWEHYQFDLYGHTQKTGKGWVVTQNQILYLRPAVLKEKIIIQSALLNFNQSSLTVEMVMWDDRKSHIKALLWSTFTYVDLKSQRRATHNEDLLALFGQLKSDKDHPDLFRERVNQLKETVG